ncbi:hypothetical protein CENSYa_0923 [Cenarchaeum symbiosum A]|uniref:Uncharacterized protein n=1 Tax=Cenarchaeum symbiosum (strain A) TaxID=414004 RepID=A0RW38_CENSY|nr:hypothetical protein CENSYa_0923 [Cenarchaeum symbiosum A]
MVAGGHYHNKFIHLAPKFRCPVLVDMFQNPAVCVWPGSYVCYFMCKSGFDARSAQSSIPAD